MYSASSTDELRCVLNRVGALNRPTHLLLLSSDASFLFFLFSCLSPDHDFLLLPSSCVEHVAIARQMGGVWSSSSHTPNYCSPLLRRMSSRASSRRLRGGQTANAGEIRRNRAADDGERKPSGPRKMTARSSTLPDHLTLLYVLFLVVFTVFALRSYRALPPSVVSGGPNSFSSQDARKHLEDIVALGVRHVGSEANEIQAVNLIVQKVEEIRKLASRQVDIELSVQQVSGSFCIDFPSTMTQLYQNITNIAVRFKRRGASPESALLINAHYDSALGSPAASDDAVSCATMLEILQTLASDPKPFLPEHSIIFLFNGAEETVLQASHGFITQHPWARQVRAFLNLEAAGAGGKEIVFQTGPDHPWLARVYANVVPHPFASVIAQEVFQSGIIPSDTDFRIFRDYGRIPGIDMAFFVNGYVYHTP